MNRNRIEDTVRRSPGVTKSELARLLGLGWGTISHHLAFLESQGIVAAFPVGKGVRLYPAGRPEARLLAVLSDGPGAALTALLAHRPGQTLSDLSRGLGISRKIVRRHLGQLGREGLVGEAGMHRRRYFLHEGAAERAQGLPIEAPAPRLFVVANQPVLQSASQPG
ncbi:MAG: ArsR family transcriptional regulator [bacterium]